MNLPTRVVAALLLSAAWTTAFLAQGQTPPPAQAGQAAPPAQPPPQGGRRGGAGGFTQFTRPIASQEVLVRGKGLYETNCSSCHAVDLRGTADGKYPNLLRSGVALRDQHGELIGARVAKHTPPISLNQTDSTAVAEYIHSIHATMSNQGSPPGRYPQNLNLNVLVGDPLSGGLGRRQHPEGDCCRRPPEQIAFHSSHPHVSKEL